MCIRDSLPRAAPRRSSRKAAVRYRFVGPRGCPARLIGASSPAAIVGGDRPHRRKAGAIHDDGARVVGGHADLQRAGRAAADGRATAADPRRAGCRLRGRRCRRRQHRRHAAADAEDPPGLARVPDRPLLPQLRSPGGTQGRAAPGVRRLRGEHRRGPPGPAGEDPRDAGARPRAEPRHRLRRTRRPGHGQLLQAAHGRRLLLADAQARRQADAEPGR